MSLSTLRLAVVFGFVGFGFGYVLSALHTVQMMPSISDALSVAIFQACKVSL